MDGMGLVVAVPSVHVCVKGNQMEKNLREQVFKKKFSDGAVVTVDYAPGESKSFVTATKKGEVILQDVEIPDGMSDDAFGKWVSALLYGQPADVEVDCPMCAGKGKVSGVDPAEFIERLGS